MKLSLAISTLTKLIDLFPTDSNVPIALFWPTLLSTSHSSVILRKSALNLLEYILKSTIEKHGYSNVAALSSTLKDSATIMEGIRAFSESLNINFVERFPFAFIKTLTTSLEDPQTAKLALKCLLVCIKQLVNETMIASYFALPFVIYGTEEYNSIISKLVFKDIKPFDFPSLIFYSFEKRTTEEITDIVRYLGNRFGTTTKIDTFAKCLTYGIQHYPSAFEPIRCYLLEKCWMMLENEQNPAQIDAISSITGCLLSISSQDITNEKITYEYPDDDILLTEISVCINGITDFKNN